MLHEELRALARLSVARGCGFAGLGILCLMVGLAGNIPVALKAGAGGTLIVSLVLIAKAQRAHLLPAQRTEVWQMLDSVRRPSKATAQPLIAEARREALRDFSLLNATLSAGFSGAAAVLQLVFPG